MNRRTLPLALAAALIWGPSPAQSLKEGERPIRPDSASTAAIGGWCDALTGAKKDECLRDERRRQEEKAKEGRSTGGSCDGLIGPERERCLRQGGSIEVGAASRGGGAGSNGRDH